ARPRTNCGSIRARPGTATSTKSPPKATTKRSFTCTGRSRPWSHCSRPGIHRFIRVTYRRANCAATRSAPGPSNLSSSSRTNGSRWQRNPDYWKPGRPYLDGVEYKIVPNRSTAILAFVAGEFDMTWPYVLTIPLLKDIKSQAPQTICELRTQNGTTNLLVNRDKPPFDN